MQPLHLWADVAFDKKKKWQVSISRFIFPKLIPLPFVQTESLPFQFIVYLYVKTFVVGDHCCGTRLKYWA